MDKTYNIDTLHQELTGYVIRAINRFSREGEIEKIIELGVKAEQIDLISKLRPTDASNFMEIPSRKITISLHAGLLNKLLSDDTIPQARENNGYEELTITLLQGLAEIASDPSERNTLISEFGIDSDLADKLMSQKLGTLHRIAYTGLMFYDLKIDNHPFSLALDFVIVDGEAIEKRNSLIIRDASLAMCTFLTGMKKPAYQQLRKGLLLTSNKGGIAKHLNEKQEGIAWKSWKDSTDLPLIDRCILMHNDVNLESLSCDHIGLRSLWPLIAQLHEKECPEQAWPSLSTPL